MGSMVGRGMVRRAMLVLAMLSLCHADFYKLLGVSKDANDRQLKKAYHKLALKHHPDKSPACKKDQESAGCKKANRNFMKLSKAYETLSDPEKRRFYDQTGFADKDAQQEHFRQQQQKNQQHRGGGGPGGGGGGGPQFGFNSGGPGGGRPPEPAGPLPYVTTLSWQRFAADAKQARKPIVLVFAPKGHNLVNIVAKFVNKEEFKGKVVFGQVVTGGGDAKGLINKFKITKLPSVMMSTKAEADQMRLFDGKLEERYLEKSVELALRTSSKTKAKEEKKPVSGKDLVTQMSKDKGADGFLEGCMGHTGMCIVCVLGGGGGGGSRRGGGASKAKSGDVKRVQQMAERVEKGKTNKKLKFRFFWLDSDQFEGFVSSVHQARCGGGDEEVCRGGASLPRIIAILPKKRKFAAFYGEWSDSKGTDQFITSVAGGDASLHKLPEGVSLKSAPPAA